MYEECSALSDILDPIEPERLFTFSFLSERTVAQLRSWLHELPQSQKGGNRGISRRAFVATSVLVADGGWWDMDGGEDYSGWKYDPEGQLESRRRAPDDADVRSVLLLTVVSVRNQRGTSGASAPISR